MHFYGNLEWQRHCALKRDHRSAFKPQNILSVSDIQALKDEQIDDIGSIRIYHTILDQLVNVIQMPDFLQVWRTTNEALAKVMCRHVFDTATDGKTALVKLVTMNHQHDL